MRNFFSNRDTQPTNQPEQPKRPTNHAFFYDRQQQDNSMSQVSCSRSKVTDHYVQELLRHNKEIK